MTSGSHPPALRERCARAASLFESLPAQDLAGRTRTLAELRPLLGEIDEMIKELDLSEPNFPREQGWLVDASSALQAIELDRGGWHVEKFAARAAEDLRRVADG